MASYTTYTNIEKKETSSEDVVINMEQELKDVKVVPTNAKDIVAEDVVVAPKVKFILMNDPQPPKVLKKDIFYVNNDWSCVHLNMADEKDWDRIDRWVGRLRRIIDTIGVFRCEDLDIIRWNSETFAKLGGFVSGSTYVGDGRLEIFQSSIGEIEDKVRSYR